MIWPVIDEVWPVLEQLINLWNFVQILVCFRPDVLKRKRLAENLFVAKVFLQQLEWLCLWCWQLSSFLSAINVFTSHHLWHPFQKRSIIVRKSQVQQLVTSETTLRAECLPGTSSYTTSTELWPLSALICCSLLMVDFIRNIQGW